MLPWCGHPDRLTQLRLCLPNVVTCYKLYWMFVIEYALALNCVMNGGETGQDLEEPGGNQCMLGAK
jgi:hypothetical protein